MIKFIKDKWSQYKESKRRKRIIAKSKVRSQLEELEESIEDLKASHERFSKYTHKVSSQSTTGEGSEMFDEFID